jgi:restriction system protein
MQDNDVVLWGIHGGRTGDADTLFLKNHVVAVGWAKAGDLGKLKPDREAFKKAVAVAFPDKKPGAIPNNAGQLFRFVHEMKPGDLVVYPFKRDRQVRIGRVTGSCYYDPALEPGYPNLRPVKWLSAIPRTRFFPRGALRNRLGHELIPDQELRRGISRSRQGEDDTSSCRR